MFVSSCPMSTNIANWTVLHRLKPKFLSRVRLFAVFGGSSSFDGTKQKEEDLSNTAVILVTTDDRVYSFGANQHGCLGLGHKQPVNTADQPAEVEELRGKQVCSVVSGSKHVLALTTSGEIYSWGDNSCGQLGVGRNATELLRPTLVGKHIAALCCGSNHTLALTQSGQVFAWGRNNYGQIGIGNNTDQFVPTKVTALEPYYVSAVACGGSHSFAVTNTGQVYAWGSNSFGQLGIGSGVHQTLPVIVPIERRIQAVACGTMHTLLMTQNGEVYSCGRNQFGQLGSGSSTISLDENRLIPTLVQCKGVRFQAVAAHYFANLSAALSVDGFCYVWGDCVTEQNPVLEPRETPLVSLENVFSVYCRLRNTAGLLALNSDAQGTYSGATNTGQTSITNATTVHNRIVNKLAQTFNDPNTSDLEFVVEGKSIYVQRWFLSISSKYFERMLSKHWHGIDDHNTKQIVIHEYTYETYYAYLRYIYTDCVELTVMEAIDLLDLAHCHLEEELQQKCVNILRVNIDVDNCCLLYHVALKYELTQLERCTIIFVMNRIFDVCRSSQFRSMDSHLCKQLMIGVSDVA